MMHKESKGEFMMNYLKYLMNTHAQFFSLKEQRDYELVLEIRKEKTLGKNFFSF